MEGWTMKSVPYCTKTNYTFNKMKNGVRSAASDKLLAIEHGQSHEMLFKYCHCHISLYNNTTYIHTYIRSAKCLQIRSGGSFYRNKFNGNFYPRRKLKEI